MASRKKRLALLSGLLALTAVSNMALGWLEGYFHHLARQPDQISTMLRGVQTSSPPSAPRPGDPGGQAIRSLVYWVGNGTYLLKPAGQCQPGTTLRPFPFVVNSGWTWDYRDTGDRWVFKVQGPPGATVYVWTGCDSVQSTPPTVIRPGRNDREA